MTGELLRRCFWLLLCAAALITATQACENVAGEHGQPSVDRLGAVDGVTAAVVVDGILPIEEALRRFREGLPPTHVLSGGAASREALVRRFVRALETQDTSAIREMVLSSAEFAFLYYPESRYTTQPYRQDPALVWFLIQQNSSKGITRLLRRYGGRPLYYIANACESHPVQQGSSRLWNECRVRRIQAATDTITERFFGSIIERSGHYKFVGYANNF